jgi:hypothetical protein
VSSGSTSYIPGTIFGAGKITLSGHNTTDGAVLGRTSISPRSYVRINHHPWVGWCD